jgi:hypothetical protein
MLGHKRRERKGIERFLVEQLDDAARDYDKRLPSRLWPIFRRRNRFNWLELYPIAIKGFRYVIKGAMRAAMPHDIFYDIATSVVVTTFDGYFDDASSSMKANDKSDAILSFKLVRSDDVPRKVKDEVGRMRQKVRSAIFAVAAYMEASQFSSLGAALDAEGDSVTRHRAEAFLNAQFRIRVSCTSIAVSLELFRRTTEKLLERLRNYRGKDVKMERRYALLSAVFVYEILDLMVSFLKTFEIQGIEELRSIHDTVNSEIETGYRKNIELFKRIQTVREREGQADDLADSMERIKERNEALAELRRIWQHLMDGVSNVERAVSGFRDRIDILEIKRDEAAENIRIMAITEVTAMLVDNVRAVESVMTMKLPNLPSLTIEDIRRYVPYRFPDVELRRLEKIAQ